MEKLKILFLGTHGQHNIGDELLLETFLAQLGDYHEYYINSYNPEFTQKQLKNNYIIQVFHTINHVRSLPKFILNADLLFFGGGSIIKELYKNVGRNRYATLMMILLIVTFANLIAQKKIIMSNIGVGPIHTKLGELIAKLILLQVDLISLRDNKSYETCLEIGIDSQTISLVPDAGFVHKPSYFVDYRRGRGTGDEKLKVALNLNFNIENSQNWNYFVDSLAKGLRCVHQVHPIEIHALPMQSKYKPNHDLDVLTTFKEQIPDIEMLMHVPGTPHDVGQIIADCDILVAERLHSLIIAAILEKPFIALSYDVKVRELIKLLEMEEFSIDINKPFEHTQLAELMLSASSNYEKIANHLKQKTGDMQLQLQSHFQSIHHFMATIG